MISRVPTTVYTYLLLSAAESILGGRMFGKFMSFILILTKIHFVEVVQSYRCSNTNNDAVLVPITIHLTVFRSRISHGCSSLFSSSRLVIKAFSLSALL